LEAFVDTVVKVKDGVSFAIIAPGGFRILSAIDQASRRLVLDLVITSGCDGEHSGPADPHHRGEAYDVRSHDFTPDQKNGILSNIMATLGYENFYGFLEAPGTDNEHFHFQVKKGTVYP
jgi:hypothetical protein